MVANNVDARINNLRNSSVFSRAAVLSVAALVVAMVCHGAAVLAYFAEPIRLTASPEEDLQFGLLIASMTGFSIGMYACRTRGFFRFLLLLRFCFLLILFYRFRFMSTIRTEIMVAMLVEVGLYEGYPTNLFLQSGMAGVAVVVFGFVGGPVAGAVQPNYGALSAFLLLCILVSLFSSLCTKFRERHILSQKAADRLEKTVVALSETNAGLQDLVFRTEKTAQRQTLQKISQELHDSIGYTLTSLVMMMEAASDIVVTQPRDVEQLIETARDRASRCLDETRAFLHALRSQPAQETTLTQAVHRLSATFEKVTAVDLRVDFGNIPLSFGAEMDLVLYGVIRESLTNSLRHGRANEVRVRFWLHPDSTLELTVVDNGCGANQVLEGFGISGMRDRLAAIHGSLTTENLGPGFRVRVILPIRGCRNG